MDYYDIISDLDTESLIRLFKEKKIFWNKMFDRFNVNLFEKIDSFTKEQLIETELEKNMNLAMVNIFVDFFKNKNIEEIVDIYIKK